MERKQYPAPPGWRFQVFEIVPGLQISNRLREPTDFEALDVDAIVCLESWEYSWSPPVPDDHLYVHFPMEDDDRVAAMTREVGRFVARLVEDGKRVLVHCTQGHNRSGLVVACALTYLGHKPADAIDLVRRKRGVDDGFGALGNEAFVDWLLGEATLRGDRDAGS